MGILLFETSAKDNINVEEMFRAITELVLKSKKVSEFKHRTLGCALASSRCSCMSDRVLNSLDITRV